MKRRDPSAGEHVSPREQALAGLAQALAAVDNPDQMSDFLTDLCTPSELEALADRWSVVPLLAAGVSYRQVHEQTGVSVTTVGRVARCLEHGAGGYRAVLDLVGQAPHVHTSGAQPATG